MKLQSLINKSTYNCIGYISNYNDLDKIEQYFIYNYPVLKEFKYINYIVNSFEFNPDIVKMLNDKLKVNIIYQGISPGHSIGAALSDNKAILESLTNWICKSTVDIILEPSILDKEIGEADFYYLNGIGYGGMKKYNFDTTSIINNDFYPQTNFYFINKDKIDYLNNEEYIISTHSELVKIPNYNGRPWEYIENWSCEDFLKECIKRNNLKSEHLISQNSYIKLIELIKNLEIHDPSHKNIMIEGICHFHNTEQNIITIND